MQNVSLFVIAFLVLCLTLPGNCSAEEGIAVRIVDEDRVPLPARAWVDVGDQRLFRPAKPDTAIPYDKDRSFSCDGEFMIAAPPGKATVHVERGKEFVPLNVDVEIAPDRFTEMTIVLKRWIDMPSEGWFSADLHVHFGHEDPRVLKQLALADDVHLVPSFTYWLRGRGETWNASWPNDDFLQPIQIDSQHLITRNNLEIERIAHDADPGGMIGATFLFNLTQPITAAAYGEYYPTDAALCRVARRHSPAAVFDADKPSWAETVVGVALGMIDTIQVCHNHYHRTVTLPGGYGMIGPISADESNAAVGDGLFHRTNALYYRFLNCGFRLGVSGGSAIGVMALPTGHNRVYARIEGTLTAEKMWAAIRAGRTFATTGPMLTLTANGQDIGSTVNIDSTDEHRTVTMQTTVKAIEPLEALQIIHNGHVVASRSLLKRSPASTLKADLKFEVSPTQSGWIASRVLYRADDGLLRQAHTSPIYISVDNKPTAVAADARYMIRWIDHLLRVAVSYPNRFPSADEQNKVLAIYAEAREAYENIERNARR